MISRKITMVGEAVEWLLQRRRSFTTVAIEPRSIRVMRLAAKALGWPSETACQLVCRAANRYS
jgi:hypothetical protein